MDISNNVRSHGRNCDTQSANRPVASRGQSESLCMLEIESESATATGKCSITNRQIARMTMAFVELAICSSRNEPRRYYHCLCANSATS